MLLLTAVAQYFTISLLIRCRAILTKRISEITTIATTTTGNTEIRRTMFRMFLEYQDDTMVKRLGRKVGQDLLHSGVVVYDGLAYLPSPRKRNRSMKQSIRVAVCWSSNLWTNFWTKSKPTYTNTTAFIHSQSCWNLEFGTPQSRTVFIYFFLLFHSINESASTCWSGL